MIDCNADEIICWLATLALAAGLAFSGSDCDQYTIDTDSYHECVSGEPLDLSSVEGN